MKTLFATLSIVALSAAPVLAGDGAIPNDALGRMGLGGMTRLSDRQGMSIRGTSIAIAFSSASATGGTTITLINQPVGQHFAISSKIAIGPGVIAGGFAVAHAN